jgi:hypothetical protein
MAISRMAFDGKQKAESLVQVAFEVTASFGGIGITGAFDQPEHQVMHRRQDPPSCAEGHASGIFMESNIPAIVQARFDEPMLPPDLEHFGRGSLLPGKAGDAEFDFTAGFIDVTPTDPGELSFETIDLCNTGPIQIIVQHGAGLEGALFEPSMTVIGFVGRQEIGFDGAKARR